MHNTFVLVTGASSGIGKQIAIQLSNSYNVILHGRDVEQLEKTKLLCCRDFNHLILNYDLMDINNIEESLSAFIKEKEINISGFVHCAGVSVMLPLKSIDIDSISKVFNVNLFSFILISKILTNKKLNNPKVNNIVLISSNIAKMGAKAFSLYAGSKSGGGGVVRSISLELAPGTRINAILPGAIPTDIIELDVEVEKRMRNTYPLGFGKPEYIANAVEFLLSDKSSWVTGQEFVIDGGGSINMTG